MAMLLEGANKMEVRGLKAITVKKADLLERVRANRESHAKAYIEAMDGYKIALRETIEAALKRVNDGDLFEDEGGSIGLPLKPESHEADYARVIDALEMATEETFDLPIDEFARYARDEWSWKARFAQTVSTYTKVK